MACHMAYLARSQPQFKQQAQANECRNSQDQAWESEEDSNIDMRGECRG